MVDILMNLQFLSTTEPPILLGQQPDSRAAMCIKRGMCFCSQPTLKAISGIQLQSPCRNTMFGWRSFGITSLRVVEGLWVGSGAWAACALPMPMMSVIVVTMVAVMRLMSCPIFAGCWVNNPHPRRKVWGLFSDQSGANEPRPTLVDRGCRLLFCAPLRMEYEEHDQCHLPLSVTGTR